MKKVKPKLYSRLFSKRVYTIVARIPRGKVMTYKQVAARAGSPGAARAVGSLMKRNYSPKIPCHRVVRSDGKIGQYNRGGKERKLELLREEGFL
ncbi:MAG: MGMT family protein [bacterium]|nr:MGMT family protein [bacterium]